MNTIVNYISKGVRRFLGINQIVQYEREILSAFKFNSTIMDSDWFRYKSISPGEAAIDYSFFYTLYRVLSAAKPENIIEFGLGQSSKMIHQYADYYGKRAVTVEHDNNWANFFKSTKDGDYPVNIKLIELEEIEFDGNITLTYKDCVKAFEGDKFDLFVVDGPFGKDFNYSRTQIISMLQYCASDDFIVIIDDYNRKGEKNMVRKLFSYFESEGIKFVFREYKGFKSHVLVTTPKFNFLTTL